MKRETKKQNRNILGELAFSLELAYLSGKIRKSLDKASPSATLAVLGRLLIEKHVIIMTQIAEKENISFEEITDQAVTAIKKDMMGSYIQYLKENNNNENN